MIRLRNLFQITLSAALLLALPVSLSAQTETPPAYVSATSLNSSSGTLTLPGSLKLTSVVSPPKGGGLPSGKVNFFYDGTNSLGSAPLTILPVTQSFPASLSFNFGYTPFAFWAASFLSATETDLAISDLSQYNDNDGPILTIIPPLGKGQFNTGAEQTLQTLPGPNYIDAIASGDFKHDGNQEFLVHLLAYGEGSGGASGQLAVVDAGPNNTPVLDSAPAAVPPCGANDATCNPEDPDTEQIVVDDFTGDGFPDIASLVTSAPATLQNFASENSYYSYYQVEKPVIRIAVNNASATTVGFTFGANAVLPTFPDVNTTKLTDIYCPNVIATGKFRKGGNTDVVSIGQQSTYTFTPTGGYSTSYCVTPAANGYLVLLLGDGKGNLTSQTPIPLGKNPSAIATGDFNKDGNLDVVVADSVTNSVTILFGNGDGTFSTKIFSVTVGNAPSQLRVADFNGDGYPDVVVGDGADGKVYVLLNDGLGQLLAPQLVYTGVAPSVNILVQDMNADGLPDVTVLQPPPPESGAVLLGTVSVLLSSASAQAALTTASQTLPAGNHTLIATFPGDTNFATSTSADVDVTVTQSAPVVTWAQPAAIEYGTPLTAAQLNATASVAGAFVYKPAAGAILPPGASTITATFAPTDSFDYSAATGSVSITVTQPSITAISPATAKQGGNAFTLTVTGQGFRQGASVLWNGSALATTYVSLGELTAVVPASLLASVGNATVTVIDPASVAVGGSAPFTIVARAVPTITWATPAAIEYGTPLGAAQLSATASVPGTFVYSPVAGTVLAPGNSTLSTTFTPTDILDYTTTTGSATIAVNQPSITSISPATGSLGGAAFTLTVNGQGLTQGAVVLWNGTALATTFVSLNQLTATVPASLLTAVSKATVTVTDPASVAVGGSEIFSINAPAPVATATGPSTSDPDTQPSVQLSLSPYPAAVTVTLTLSFTPDTAGQPVDPAVLFANGTTTDTFVIPANSTAAIAPVSLQTGTTAGMITVTVLLTADGVNITPTGLAPVTIGVAALPPIINSVTLTRTGKTMLVVITGLSSPRDMTQAQFQFTAAPGASLSTTSLTVSAVAAKFTSWYQDDQSAAFGTAFQYTQPFTLDSDATDVKSVTVTLTNSVGESQPATAQ